MNLSSISPVLHLNAWIACSFWLIWLVSSFLGLLITDACFLEFNVYGDVSIIYKDSKLLLIYCITNQPTLMGFLDSGLLLTWQPAPDIPQYSHTEASCHNLIGAHWLPTLHCPYCTAHTALPILHCPYCKTDNHPAQELAGNTFEKIALQNDTVPLKSGAPPWDLEIMQRQRRKRRRTTKHSAI